MKSYLTPKQLAFDYDVSETAVIRWRRTGYLPNIKVGSRWRIDTGVDLESLSNEWTSTGRNEVERLLS